MPAAAQPLPLSEAERVIAWRQTCLEEVGMRKGAAVILAATRADLHQIITVYQQGCPVNLLLRIFKEESDARPNPPPA